MDENILLFVLIGFIAEMIDGSLGMAYGVSATSFLLSLGLPHCQRQRSYAPEIVTTATSGFFHMKFGNIKKISS